MLKKRKKKKERKVFVKKFIFCNFNTTPKFNKTHVHLANELGQINGNRIKNRLQVGGLHVGSNDFTCIIIIIIMNKKNY